MLSRMTSSLASSAVAVESSMSLILLLVVDLRSDLDRAMVGGVKVCDVKGKVVGRYLNCFGRLNSLKLTNLVLSRLFVNYRPIQHAT